MTVEDVAEIVSGRYHIAFSALVGADTLSREGVEIKQYNALHLTRYAKGMIQKQLQVTKLAKLEVYGLVFTPNSLPNAFHYMFDKPASLLYVQRLQEEVVYSNYSEPMLLEALKKEGDRNISTLYSVTERLANEVEDLAAEYGYEKVWSYIDGGITDTLAILGYIEDDIDIELAKAMEGER